MNYRQLTSFKAFEELSGGTNHVKVSLLGLVLMLALADKNVVTWTTKDVDSGTYPE